MSNLGHRVAFWATRNFKLGMVVAAVGFGMHIVSGGVGLLNAIGAIVAIGGVIVAMLGTIS